jgi:hypothetical protein
MNSAAELDARIRRQRKRLLELCVLERDLVTEQRIAIRELNRYRYEPLPIPKPPNRDAVLKLCEHQPAVVVHRSKRTFAPTPPLLINDESPVVSGLIAPFSDWTRVADRPTYVPYIEQLPAASIEIPMRVALVFEYEGEVVGVAEKFEATPLALFGSFRLSHGFGSRVLEMVRSGMLTGLAPVLTPLETHRDGEIVVRKRTRLEMVAIARESAYADAWVAVRPPRGGT